MSLDNIFDISLGELADLPTFKPFNDGVHACEIKFAAKEVKGKPAIEIGLKLVNTVELADPSLTPDEPGSECSILCNLDNEYGQGNLKAICEPIAAHFGIDMKSPGSMRQVAEKANGMVVNVVTKQRKGKEEGQVFSGIKAVSVPV